MRLALTVIVAAALVGGCANMGGMHMGMGSSEAHMGSPKAQMMASAQSAAPASISHHATIADMNGNVLREGSNGYTCLPDNPNNDGPDPMCLDESWTNLVSALMGQSDPTYDSIGIAYMLGGDAAVSNTDPFATSFTSEDDWVDGLGAHLMIVAPGDGPWADYSADPFNGGPWVMWPGTPYEHLMVPIDSYGK